MVWRVFQNYCIFYDSAGSANMQESYFVSHVMGELNLYVRSVHTGSIGPSVCCSGKLKHSSLLYLTSSDVAETGALKTQILFILKSDLNTDESCHAF